MVRPTVKVVWNHKNRTNSKSGRYPMYLRVTQYRKSIFLNLKEVGVPNLLKQETSLTNLSDRRNEWIKGRSDAFELNQMIKQSVDKVDTYITERLHRELSLSLPMIKDIFLDRSLNQLTFNLYVENYINRSKELRRRAENTKKVYRTFLKKLNEYNPNWSFFQIDYKSVTLFIQWMRNDQGLRIETIDKYTDKFRKIYHQASLEGLCPVNAYLTDGLKEMRQIDGDPEVSGVSLNREEIQKWIDVQLSERMAYHRDVFLVCINLACYYNDLKVMRTSEIYVDSSSEGEKFTAIATKRYKPAKGDSQPIYGRLSARSLDILFKIHNVDSLDDLMSIDKPLIPDMITDQIYRDNLKVIAKAAGIKKNVTTRVSKYTGRDLLEERNSGSLIRHTTGHTNELQSSKYSRKEGKEAMRQITSVDF